MRKQKLSEMLFGVPKVKFKTLKEELMKAPSIGHLLIVQAFSGGTEAGVLFVDHVDIVKSHTVIIYNKYKREIYAQEVESTDLSPTKAIIYYTNNTKLEITRL